MSTAPLNALTEKIRSTHPGAYDDLDDAELTKRVLAKYPQYSDLAAPPVQPPKVDMQEDASVPTGYNSDAGGKLKGLPGVNPHTPTPSEAAGDVGLVAGGAYGAGSSIIPALAKKAAPMALPAAGSYLINKARGIPIVGPIIDKIPFAEALPWLMSGGKEKGISAEAEGEAVAAKPTFSKTPLGPEAPEPALMKSRSLAEAETPASIPTSQSGEALATVGKPSAPAESAIPTGAPEGAAIDTTPPVSKAKVGDLLNEGLGGKSLLPNVPLKDQMPGKVPAGHTPVKSSAIKSYSYDPESKEFEFVTPSGAHYVHGDVSPEQMADFEKAESKGKAFNQIKNNSVYVGKIVNGKRVAVKPPKNMASASPD